MCNIWILKKYSEIECLVPLFQLSQVEPPPWTWRLGLEYTHRTNHTRRMAITVFIMEYIVLLLTWFSSSNIWLLVITFVHSQFSLFFCSPSPGVNIRYNLSQDTSTAGENVILAINKKNISHKGLFTHYVIKKGGGAYPV